MKKRKSVGLLAAGALAALIGGSSANAGTLTLTVQYMGSTTNAPVNANVALNLGQLDFTQATSWNSTYKHEFAVYATFTDGSTGEDFRGIVFDVNAGSGLSIYGPTQGFPNNKSWFSNNPIDPDTTAALFSTNADAGTVTTDLRGVTVIQSDAGAANYFQLAETTAAGGWRYPSPFKLGTFFVTSGDTAAPTSIGVTETDAANNTPNFSYFTGNTGGAGPYSTVAGGLTSVGYTFAQPSPPSEIPLPPAFWGGMVLLGGVGFVRRARSAR